MNMHITRERRREIERQIDELIDMLNLIDGDCDLEDNADLERDLDTDESDGDVYDETVTWPEHHPSRYEVALSGEQEDDEDGNDAEADNDLEGSLGWTEHDNQSSACRYGNGITDGEQDVGDEPEDDPAEAHSGDLDALLTFEGSGQALAASLLRSIGRTMREPEPASMFLRIVQQ
jgi:hypothetical protein